MSYQYSILNVKNTDMIMCIIFYGSVHALYLYLYFCLYLYYTYMHAQEKSFLYFYSRFNMESRLLYRSGTSRKQFASKCESISEYSTNKF